jgi:hypothetical protein
MVLENRAVVSTIGFPRPSNERDDAISERAFASLSKQHPSPERSFELCLGDRIYRLIARARHNDSKLSAPSGSDARESNRLLGFSVSTVVGVAGPDHCNNDFEIAILPSYQHFRPSIRRQDHQCPFGSNGRAILHCFACAAGATIDKMVIMQAANGEIRMVNRAPGFAFPVDYSLSLKSGHK